jgi:hypothetical protein
MRLAFQDVHVDGPYNRLFMLSLKYFLANGECLHWNWTKIAKSYHKLSLGPQHQIYSFQNSFICAIYKLKALGLWNLHIEVYKGMLDTSNYQPWCMTNNC